MQMIYHYDITGVFDGATMEIDDTAGAPPSWTFTPPPQTDSSHWAYFVGPDWIVIDERPVFTPPEPPAAVPTTPTTPAANPALSGQGPSVI